MREVTRVIDEAWRICRERCVTLIGPRPSRWRFIAYDAWLTRRNRYSYETPSVFDVIEACSRTRTTDDVKQMILKAHADLHKLLQLSSADYARIARSPEWS